jgi:phage replication initiation protein
MSPWVRWEVEFHSKDREIPWDVLLEPGRFVAGAYPCMAWIHDEASRIKTFKQTAVIGYNAMTYHARQAYGRLFNVMLAVEGTPEKVLEKLIRSGKPARLDFPAPPEYVDELKGKAKG